MISKSNVKFTDSNVKFTDSNVKFTDSEVRMASRFASSTQQEIEKLLEDKDSMILALTFLHLIDCFIKTVKICLSLSCTFSSV